MKRTTIAAGALALAAGLFFMPDAMANDATCADGDTVNQDTGISVVCAGGDQGTQTGHVYADGHGDTDNPEPLDGYIGANNDNDDAGVVGCAEGNYQDDTDDPANGEADPNVIYTVGGEPPSGEPGPCTPAP